MEQNTHLAEEETIADIFDVRVVAFDACIYNVCGRLYERAFDYFFSQKEPYLRKHPESYHLGLFWAKNLEKLFGCWFFFLGQYF